MSNKTFFWNVRGLNDPDKHPLFVNWLTTSKVCFGALLETHIKEPQLAYVMNKTCRDWSYTSNHASDHDGRIVIIWKHPVNVTPLHQTRQSLTCEITIGRQQKFVYTAIYAANTYAERLPLWVDLLQQQQTLSLDASPWIVGGDFNQIIHCSEHSLPTINSFDTPMVELRDIFSDLGIFDIRYNGPRFTWSNKCPSSPIAKKLDRVLVNHQWIASFPNSQAFFNPPEFSDHSPAILDLAVALPTSGTKPFKFFNYLTKHPLFYQTVHAAWNQAGGIAWDLSHLCVKLKIIKRDLKNLNKDNFSNIQDRVRDANSLLKIAQVNSLNDPSSENFKEEKELHDRWEFLRTIEESYFRQRSRINWLREGDHNTSFFHRLTQVRNSINSIRSFCLSTGEIITDPIQMGTLAVNHFQNLLAPQNQSTVPISPTWIHGLTDFRCANEYSYYMALFPTAEEIKSTLFKLNKNKSPGPDGLTSGFFKETWQILGAELIRSIQTFFVSGFLPPAANSTILTLVPKRIGASAITDYRPISCCNTIYKIISKLLLKRLKPILPTLILPNQTAFVQGRLLVENTILASEIIHGYHKDRGPKRITLKVDIEKAFDTVNWDFIFNLLQGLDIPHPYLAWLFPCVTSPSFMIGFNGTVQGYFKSTRGLRQGDPLSPYLFVMVMNCLSMLLDKGAAEGEFGYHHHCRDSKLTHLCFADDLLIFCDGSLQSVKNVLQILRNFTLLSGLSVNISKTSFFTCGLSSQEIAQITAETGLTADSLPVRYLGIPLCTKKLSMANCEPLIQQVKNRVNSWSAKSLSFAGRLLLINTVIAGISNFWCSTFTIPKQCIKIINSLSVELTFGGDQRKAITQLG